jgi:hypothetical protein
VRFEVFGARLDLDHTRAPTHAKTWQALLLFYELRQCRRRDLDQLTSCQKLDIPHVVCNLWKLVPGGRKEHREVLTELGEA